MRPFPVDLLRLVETCTARPVPQKAGRDLGERNLEFIGDDNSTRPACGVTPSSCWDDFSQRWAAIYDDLMLAHPVTGSVAPHHDSEAFTDVNREGSEKEDSESDDERRLIGAQRAATESTKRFKRREEPSCMGFDCAVCVRSSSPIVMALASLASSLTTPGPSRTGLPPMAAEILKRTCRSLIDFPYTMYQQYRAEAAHQAASSADTTADDAHRSLLLVRNDVVDTRVSGEQELYSEQHPDAHRREEAIFLEEAKQYVERLCDAVLLLSSCQTRVDPDPASPHSCSATGAFEEDYESIPRDAALQGSLILNDAREYLVIFFVQLLVQRGALPVLLQRLQQQSSHFFHSTAYTAQNDGAVADPSVPLTGESAAVSYDRRRYHDLCCCHCGLSLIFSGIASASAVPRRRVLALSREAHAHDSDAIGTSVMNVTGSSAEKESQQTAAEASTRLNTECARLFGKEALLSTTSETDGLPLLVALARHNNSCDAATTTLTRRRDEGGDASRATTTTPAHISEGWTTAVLTLLSLAASTTAVSSASRANITRWLANEVVSSSMNDYASFLRAPLRSDPLPVEENDSAPSQTHGHHPVFLDVIEVKLQTMRELVAFTLFSVVPCQLPTARHVLRYLFQQVAFQALTEWVSAHVTRSSDEPPRAPTLPRRLLEPVFACWSAKSQTQHLPFSVLTTQMHSTMFSLLLLHHEFAVRHSPGQSSESPKPSSSSSTTTTTYSLAPMLNRFWIAALHSGIGHRLESVRSVELREEGQTVAALYAFLFAPSGETADTLLKEESYSSLLQTWMRLEEHEVTDLTSTAYNTGGGGGGRGVQQNIRGRGLLEAKLHSTLDSKADTYRKVLFLSQMWCRREASHDQNEVFPLDPDMPYTFFVSPLSPSHQRKENLPLASRDAARLTAGDHPEPNGALDGTMKEVSEPLRGFGTQRLDADELDDGVSICGSFRESYNLLVGVGRPPNAQLHEIQRALESGLRGLTRCLQHLYQHLMRQQGSPNRRVGTQEVSGNSNAPLSRGLSEGEIAALTAELSPMMPSLLASLVGIQIHAPPERTTELLHLRHECVVGLVVFTPRTALFQLSQVVYGRRYSVYQRVEVIKAIGEAAVLLSAVPAPSFPPSEGSSSGSPEVGNGGAGRSATGRRVYPPIPDSTANTHTVRPNSVQQMILGGPLPARPAAKAITVSEGHHTRRWGSADPARKQRLRQQRSYTNYLGTVAPYFLSTLLIHAEAVPLAKTKSETASGAGSDAVDPLMSIVDTYQFFQERDPYTPCEILRSCIRVFQSIRSVRHVAPDLCRQHVDFFLAACLHHPNGSVRQQAWLCLCETMRCWCGAAPYIDLTDSDDPHSLSPLFSGGTENLNAQGSANARPHNSRTVGTAAATQSLMFSEEWITALSVISTFAARQVEVAQHNESETRVIRLVVGSLRELMAEDRDWEAVRQCVAARNVMIEELS